MQMASKQLRRICSQLGRNALKVGIAGFGGVAALKVACPPEPLDAWCRRRTVSFVQPEEVQSEREALELLAEVAGVGPRQLNAVLRCFWSGVEQWAEALWARPLQSFPRRRRGRWPSRWCKRPALQGCCLRWTKLTRPCRQQGPGVDVGGDSPMYAGTDAARLLGDDLERALEQLREDGIVLVSAPDVMHGLRKLLHLPPAGRPVREVPSAEVLSASGAAAPQTPSVGRRHFLLRGSEVAEQAVVPLLTPLLPLCWRYFVENRPDASPGCLADQEACSRVYLSECQLLVSDPGAVHQIWHCDNLRPGLTVILPLTEVDEELGPTHLLPGTHHLGGAKVGSALGSLRRAGGAIAAPLVPGQALIYDARLMHRGLGNSSYNRCRVVVVMRLDMLDTPPPGATVVQTAMVRALGQALGGLSYLYRFLPARS
ncbi:unnamed protein product [Effrenium voratum]|nr:unnamed protein product [Effrenium voratum]